MTLQSSYVAGASHATKISNVGSPMFVNRIRKIVNFFFLGSFWYSKYKKIKKMKLRRFDAISIV